MHSPPPIRREHSHGGKAPVRVLQAPYQKVHKGGQTASLTTVPTPSYADIAASSTSSTTSTDSTSSNSSTSSSSNILPNETSNSSQGHAAIQQQNQQNQQKPQQQQSTALIYIDYRNYVFQPLESVSKVTFDSYCGPTPESNWVVPNLLLVGAYPASTDDEETLDLITSILKEGVTKFVCLQQEVRIFVHILHFLLFLPCSCHIYITFHSFFLNFSTGNMELLNKCGDQAKH